MEDFFEKMIRISFVPFYGSEVSMKALVEELSSLCITIKKVREKKKPCPARILFWHASSM